MVRLKSRIFGDYMVSMPYFNYGGALTDSPNITRQLMTEAGALAERLGCAHIEFRDTAPQQPWVVRTDKVVMELSLPESFESLWNMFGPKLRAQVRRPQKEGADIVWGNEELLSDFYSIFARNMRDLGTPVYPLRFFSAILHAFPKQTSIGIVRYMNRAVAGCFLVGFRERLEIPWASSLREFNSIGVNMLLYSESLKQAIEKGYRVFDFGRSSVGSGTYRFKKQWGARERQLYWHYWLRSGATLPNLTPNNRKYRLAIEVWKRLPLFVANRLGPVLVENLP